MTCLARICRVLGIICTLAPMTLWAAVPVKSMVIFGDSLSDNGNTTHLLKSLRNDESPAYLVNPLKTFVINKMTEFASDYHVPQVVLDSGVGMANTFFEGEFIPLLSSMIARVRLIPVLPGEPYWQSHFSNGRVWNEYLAPMLDVDREDLIYFTNQAYGGSWAQTYDYQLTVWNLIRHPVETLRTLVVGKLIPPSLGLTVQTYLLTHPKLDEKTVYFVFTGANDYLNVLKFEDNYNPAVMSAFVDNVIEGLTAGVHKLTKAGARRVVILGLPTVGYTPKFVNTMDRDVLNNAIHMHNERLVLKVEEWQAATPEVDFLYVDVQPFLTKALDRPADYGFMNVNDACIDVKFPLYNAFSNSPFAGNFVLQYAQILQYRDKSFTPGEKNYHVCDAPEKYLFWDEVHPSTRAHRYLAYEVCEVMREHGYQATCQQPPNA